MTLPADLLKLDTDQLTLDTDDLSLEDESVVVAVLSTAPQNPVISSTRPANLSRSNR